MNRAVVYKTALLAAAFASGSLAACAHKPALKPAPGAPVQPGDRSVALTEVAGVGIAVKGEWKGDPPNLAERVLPLQVTIVNSSGKMLRVSYRDFSLAGISGTTYVPIPPLKAGGHAGASSARGQWQLASYLAPPLQQWALTGFDYRRFYIAPHLSSFYPSLEPFPGAFPYDPLWYEKLYATWPKGFPTKDMQNKALPEGALKDGGDLTGFLYFQPVNKRESSIQFDMVLADASDGQTFGEVHIPFVRGK